MPNVKRSDLANNNKKNTKVGLAIIKITWPKLVLTLLIQGVKVKKF